VVSFISVKANPTCRLMNATGEEDSYVLQ